MKNILLPIHDDCGQDARIEAALELARATDGHLSCVCVVERPFVLTGEFYLSGNVTTMVDDEARDAAMANKARIEQQLARESVPWDMREVTGTFADAIALNAALADVIVLNSRLSDPADADMPGLVASALFGTRKPALVVPEHGLPFDPFGAAVIAWDGSDPATAAMSAAKPLLRLARSVTLVEILTGRSGTAADEAASYLSRHGAHAEIVRLAGDGTPVSTMLLDECRRRSAYCVMGAFGRSRLSETLFGGVSRRMLDETGVPLFMAH